MTRIKSDLYELCKRSKVALNYRLDRIIELCDLMLMDYYVFPWPVARKAAHSIAHGVGDVCGFLRLFPRLPAYKLSGASWTIVYVGSENGLQEISHLFFENGVNQQALDRVALRQLSSHTQRWLAEDADLVVCELSGLHSWTPRMPLTFTVPTWVQQVLVIPEPPEALIAGKRFKGLINRAQKSGFTHRFSQSKADFDHFYQHMYLPFVQSRHADLALITPYPDLWRWFTRGGLVLIMRGDQAVAGMVCYMAHDICYPIEEGVLEADLHVWQQGINAFLFWCVICWGYAQGTRVIDMGGSHALRSNGSLINKRRWGARVTRRRRICNDWIFLVRDLPSSLQEHINRLGFITNIRGKYYGVLLNAGPTAVTEADIQQETLAAKLEGLDGLAAIFPDGRFKIYN